MPCLCYRACLEGLFMSFMTNKSIFNFEGQEAYPFLNYWNLDQTFLIEGTTSQDALENLIHLVSLKNHHVKLYQDANFFECSQ